MIYLDVTSSCKSPMNTGVQRVVRGLFRTLSAARPGGVAPVLWDPGLGAYCDLSPWERGWLEAPFRAVQRSGRGADAEPGRRANPVPVVSKIVRSLAHRWNRLDLASVLTAADTLFVPEIFQDNRVPWLAALRGNTPARRVAVCHDAIAWRRPDLTPPARLAGFVEYLAALQTFDQVVAVSQETRAELLAWWLEHGLPAAPVSVLGWPVDHAGEPRRVRPPQHSRTKTVLCVGTFEPRKNHLALLAAASMLWQRGADFELVLVGRTTAQWGARVLAAAEELRIAARPVRWLRHVDDNRLREAYEACAFSVFPSLVEGFGLPILESLWYGRPCVCGTNGALGEIAAGGGCLAMDQTEPSAIAAAIEQLLLDDRLYKRLCEEARTRAFDTWARYAERLVPLFAPPEPA